MSAKRVIDDHLELANIGTKTHAQIDTHIADPSAHHIKYTGAEAVVAVETVDIFLKNDADDITSGKLGIKISSFGVLTRFGIRYPGLQINTTAISGYSIGAERTSETTNGCAHIDYFRRRASSAVIDNDLLGEFLFWGWDGSDYSIAAMFRSAVDGVVTDNCIPSDFSFRTRPAGNTDTRPPERLAIRSNGNIDIFNNKITNPKNHIYSALSGTKKLIEIDIGGMPYYYEVYPTKA